jgi:hypothetical protein
MLREIVVSGEVLLNRVNNNTLREDLGLKALGHRGTVLDAIDYPRQKSTKYQWKNL